MPKLRDARFTRGRSEPGAGTQLHVRRWQDAAMLLSGLYRQPGGDADPHVALVIDADEDMLVQLADPESRLPAACGRTTSGSCRRTPAMPKSTSARIASATSRTASAIRSAIASRQRSAVRRSGAFSPTPSRTGRYVAGATFCGLVKFLAPLAFPWMLKVMLDDVVLNTNVGGRRRRANASSISSCGVLDRSTSPGWSRRTFAACSPRSPDIA